AAGLAVAPSRRRPRRAPSRPAARSLLAGGPLARGARGRGTGVEEAVAHEPGDERRLGGNHASGGRAVDHHLFGQSVEQVERRKAPVGEARRIDLLRLEVEKGRAETEVAVGLAAATGA